MDNRQIRIERACGKVADVAFPHFMDDTKREKMASALAELAKTIIDEVTATPPITRRRRLG